MRSFLNNFFRSTWNRLTKEPLLASFVCTLVYFTVLLSLFPSGYAINDDMKMIPLVAGYPTGHPVPFLIFSNVLLGFLLVALYKLPTVLNWEMLIFISLQFAAVWLLLHQIISSKLTRATKAFGVVVVLLCETYFALNLTFTTTAAFVSIAGCCGLIYGSRANTGSTRGQIMLGVTLIFSASLIRFAMAVLMLVFGLPYLLFARRDVNWKRLLMAVFTTGLLVSGSWMFDRLYLRASPAWNTFNLYQYTGAQVQDTHRLENLGKTIRRISWSPNDQELFVRWFYPDYGTYSLDRIRFLLQHVSPVSTNPTATVLSVLKTPFAPFLLPYLLGIIASSLWMYSHTEWKRSLLPWLGIWGICVVVNVYLAVTWKIADRIFLPTFSAAALLTYMVPFWMKEDEHFSASAQPVERDRHVWALYGAVAVLAVACVIMLTQSYNTAAVYRDKRVLYQKILSDIAKLERNGTLAQNALILSPAHGLPMEWSDPFTLQFPSVAYFDMGWMSFSPTYDQVLSTHGIINFPDALYEQGNLYLMTRSNILRYVARYFQEHRGVAVTFKSLYSMPNIKDDPVYDDVHLYKVILSP